MKRKIKLTEQLNKLKIECRQLQGHCDVVDDQKQWMESQNEALMEMNR